MSDKKQKIILAQIETQEVAQTEFSQFEEEGRRHGMVGIIQEVHLVDG